MKYVVKHTYMYTEEVEVEAEDEKEALKKALETEGVRNNDDWLYDAKVMPQIRKYSG